MKPYLNIIAQEWSARADELAQWAYEHLVNRTDVWGSYLSMEKRRAGLNYFFTAPFPAARGKQFLTKPTLARHFTGLDGHLISLHSTSADRTSRWLAIDIDRHDGEENVSPENNFAAALAWHDQLQAMGFDPILMDSNGNGGFHVLTIFSEPVPTPDVYGLGLTITADWERRGLSRNPEKYPKQAHPEEGHFGNCLRLFGRHHTREHFTRVWSGDPDLQEPWLEGAGAIDRILQTRLSSPSLVPQRGLTEDELKKKLPPPGSKKQRVRICVDLDGVLAEYDGWKGLDFTGSPLPGAVEFTRKLSEIGEVLIYTTRCNVEIHREELKEPTRPASDLAPRLVHSVRYWLEKHRFSYHDIFAGQGKPIASAYIDDRAVACTPQNNPQAYALALMRARELCGRHRESSPAERDDQLSALMDQWGALPEATKASILELAGGGKAKATVKPKTKPKKNAKPGKS